MTTHLDFQLATLLLAIAVALVAAGAAAMPVRLRSGGGTVARYRQVIPGAFYGSDVGAEHKRRRLLLDISTVVATVAAALWFSPGYLAFAFVWAALAVACATDIRAFRLPHRLTLTNAIASVAFAALVTGTVTGTALAIGCGLAYGFFYFVIGVASNGKLGMGDVYFAIGCGALSGTFGGLWGVLVAFVGTAAVSVVVVVALLIKKRGKVTRSHALPFGPNIAIGAILVPLLAIVASMVTIDGNTFIGFIAERILP